MNGFEIDPDSLRAAGDGLSRRTDELEAVVDGFAARLAALGEPWGGDDLGFLIGECYRPARDAAMACFDANLDELVVHSARLRRMAESYDRAEQENEQLMSRLQARLTGM